MSQATAGLYEQIVDAIGDIYGVHPGVRAVHTNGVLLHGRFTASPEAAALSRAQHLQGDPVEATVRFSNGGGKPGVHDGKADGRGMAVKLYLPDGTTTDIVALDLPLFFVRTPEDFLEFTRARRPDPETGKPDLALMGAFLEAHPEAVPGIQAALSAKPLESYARSVYNAIHTFHLENAHGERRAVRYTLVPEAGIATLEPEDALGRGPEYLREEVIDRLSDAPVVFALVAQLAEPGDPEDDPTVAWPDERERVTLGRLELTGPETEREQGDDVLVFDPTRVTDGIECSDDPILHARSHAYAVSVLRRSGIARR